MRLIVWILVNMASVGAATWLFEGISIEGADTNAKLLTLLGVGAIFGVVTSFVKPLVKLLALPFIILTLGLLLLVINAGMLMLTSALAGGVGLGFHVDGFGTAIWGSIVISVVAWIVSAILPDPDDR